jgi:hypothetical protein
MFKSRTSGNDPTAPPSTLTTSDLRWWEARNASLCPTVQSVDGNGAIITSSHHHSSQSMSVSINTNNTIHLLLLLYLLLK